MKSWYYFEQDKNENDCGIRLRVRFDTLSERGFYIEYRKAGSFDWVRTLTNKSCQACVEEMSIFCDKCPHINSNIRQGITTRFENWVVEQCNSVNGSDYRKINKLQDDLIAALRAFETEIESMREKEMRKP